ncbi:hypothetical protein GVN18_32570, partial [Pseudomonas sp. ODNR1LW]|nr:hypothetical protein [Pseudomonas sp. ODNR1LW]
MRILPILVPVFLVLALVSGWLSPGLPEEPPGVRRGAGATSGPMLRPGETAAAALSFLRT